MFDVVFLYTTMSGRRDKPSKTLPNEDINAMRAKTINTLDIRAFRGLRELNPSLP